MQCIILAGGLGTRMHQYTQDIPKAMIPVQGSPFIDHLLATLKDGGITHVILSIGYKGNILRNHLGNGQRSGLAIDYVDEGSNLLGTGGALRLVSDQIKNLSPSFFVTYGDAYLSVDLKAMWARGQVCQQAVLMSVFRNEGAWDNSNVAWEDGRLTYDKKCSVLPTARFQFIDYGMSIIKREVLKDIPGNAKVDLADVLHRLSLAGDVSGFEVFKRFYEVGSHKGLADLNDHLTSTESFRS